MYFCTDSIRETDSSNHNGAEEKRTRKKKGKFALTLTIDRQNKFDHSHRRRQFDRFPHRGGRLRDEKYLMRLDIISILPPTLFLGTKFGDIYGVNLCFMKLSTLVVKTELDNLMESTLLLTIIV